MHQLRLRNATLRISAIVTMGDSAHALAALAGVPLLQQYAAADGPAWTEAAHRPELSLVVQRQPVAGSPYARFRAVCELPHPPPAVLHALCDCPARLRWDSAVARLDTVDLPVPAASTRLLLLHSQTHAVGPISARDFVDAVAVVGPLDGGVFVNTGASVVDGRFPEQRGVVRGVNSPGGGWLLAPCGDGSSTRVTYVIHSDIRGWLPAAVVNAALVSTYVSFFRELRGHLAVAAHGAAHA